MPLKFVLSLRRLNYLKHIIDRQDNELIKRIFNAQKVNQSPGDWIELVKTDFKIIDEEFNEANIQRISAKDFKVGMRGKIRNAAFQHLQGLQENHTKIKDICYTKFKPQTYLTSHMLSNKEVAMLVALRSQTVKNIKNNFHTWYKSDRKCDLCKNEDDTQEHCMKCPEIQKVIGQQDHIKYEHINGSPAQQKAVANLFLHLLETRDDLLRSLPGACNNTGP
jgi:hypothetical protein